MHREELSKEAQLDLVDKAIVGDGQALEELLRSTSGLVFNLALRFLGTVHDAEDASQEIAVKIMTRLSTFRKESAFSTWVYRIAVNHLKDCRTHQFANAPFSFEMYGADIVDERAKDVPDLSEGVDRGMLARELKLSCHERDAAVPRRRQPLRLRAGHHVQGGQLHRGRRAGHHARGVPPAPVARRKTVAEFFGRVLSARRRGDVARASGA